ncbi:hypothetical protein [Nocardia sp. NPDC051750]|uniref:hypothetical protein n=1 Tax=Nocardia sp. NPDC051750 TaxID=3364325 RepID=UPI0037A54DF5
MIEMDLTKDGPEDIAATVFALSAMPLLDRRAECVAEGKVKAALWLDGELVNLGMNAGERVTCQQCGTWVSECRHNE